MTFSEVLIKRINGLIETANKDSSWEMEAVAEMMKAVHLLGTLTDAQGVPDPEEVSYDRANSVPVAWIAFAGNGNIRVWTSDEGRAKQEKERGLDLRAFTLAELVALAAKTPARSSWRPDTCYLERSAVRSILIGQPDENLHITELVLAEVDALPIVAVGDAPDEDHPDCATARERELYDALMGLASAVTARQGWSKWVQGGVQIAPIVHKALRLDASSVPSTHRESPGGEA